MKLHKKKCRPSMAQNKTFPTIKEDIHLSLFTPRLVLNPTLEDPNDINYYHCESCNFKAESMYKYRVHGARIHQSCLKCKKCSLFCSSVNDKFVHEWEAHRSDLMSKCRYCCFYSSMKVVERHERDHSPICCYHCDFSSLSIPLFNQHILKSHPDKEPSSCHKCGYQTMDPARLKEHLVKMHLKNHCNYCNHFEFSMLDLRKHKIDDHPEKCYGCKECPFIATDKSSARSHMKNPEFHNFTCDECSYRGASLKDMARHIFKHHYRSYYHWCVVCSFKASSREFLLKHELNQHLGRVYRCTNCLYYCFNIDALNNHFTKSHKQKS